MILQSFLIYIVVFMVIFLLHTLRLISATHFGLAVDAAFWNPLADYATGRIAIAPPQFETWVQTATLSSERYRFFHWELEFPEVFFDRYGRQRGEAAGFDTVLGNPPYVRDEALSPVGELMVALPIASPPDALRAEVEPMVMRLIELTRQA